ncbi:hypothetical protein L210DRAFT_3499469 [Boletus edulis BED1]|uniref:Uncharacterized protein n=1 Tax=Boletus edulis BED1 TaxID=1328754 RepID=A0AAD4GM76_BOLED|nr:hypothetical protein L210DRAFT_3499469 [Boletus edulis BED1]
MSTALRRSLDHFPVHLSQYSHTNVLHEFRRASCHHPIVTVKILIRVEWGITSGTAGAQSVISKHKVHVDKIVGNERGYRTFLCSLQEHWQTSPTCACPGNECSSSFHICIPACTGEVYWGQWGVPPQITIR